MIYHVIALLAGFLLDSCFGDPYYLPHPVRLIGRLISALEGKLLKDEYSPQEKRGKGLELVFIVCFVTLFLTMAVGYFSYRIHPYAGCVVEAVLSYYALAAKSLKFESMKVYKELENGDILRARQCVSMIVGRDTQNLDENGIRRACVETVAENTSDGVIAPMLYLALGGPALGLLYKAINTMDSMVGYKNDKYSDYGYYAAKLDDIVNYVPARISAYLMIVSCFFCGRDYSVIKALQIYKRDRYNHSSPNSAHTEAVCAGALGLKLAGPSSYFGQIVDKPFIGNDIRKIENDDIKRVNRLMYATAVACLIICVVTLCMVEIFTGII